MRMRFLQKLGKAAGLGRLVALSAFTLVFTTTVSGQISIGAGTAPVSKPTGGFNINGVLKVNSSTGDWLAGTGTGGHVLHNNGNVLNGDSTFHIIDAINNGDNVFVGGLKKNGNPNGYTWKTGGASPAKCNINHAIIHISKASNGDTWITLSGDRESVTGNSFISLALHQKSLTISGNSFVSAASNSTGGREPGDVQVSAEFTGGGTNPNLYLEEWKLVGSSYVWAPITINPPNKVVAYGKTNAAPITGMPYTVFGGTTYQTNSFIEVSFNISEIYRNSSTPCVGSIKSMLLLTKSSQSETADLSDFVTPQQINLDITVGPPTASGANYCVGQTINALTASGSGSVFKWYTAVDGNGKPTGTATTGSSYTPSINNTIAADHNFYVTQSLDGCESDPTTVTVKVVANPVAYTLSGNQICSADGNVGVLTLSNSQTGVSYKLKLASDDSEVAGSGKTGTTGSALEWTGIAPGISYYVVATGATPTSCTSTSNSASVTGGTSPTVYALSGNSLCASAPNTGVITLGNSESGVSYQLKTGTTSVQDAKAGTGAALEWTGLTAGVNYFVEATGAAPTNCKSTTDNASVTEVANPEVFDLTGSSICASAPNTGVVTLSSSVSGVSYQLKKANHETVQDAKSGTGSALEWTGLAAGFSYYVEATGAAPTSCTSQTSSAAVSEVANPAIYCLSGNAICSADPNTGVITLSNSQTGVSYQLKRSNDNSNVQDAQTGTNGTALHWTELPAEVSFYVLASIGSPISCSSSTDPATVTVSENPIQPTVQIVNPTCSTSTGTVTVLTPRAEGLLYSFNDGEFGESYGPFTFEAGAGYKIEVKNSASGCISVPQECSAEVKAFISNPAVLETGAVIPGTRKTKVLAAPNPFNDRVRFTMESGISGQGSLEVYNSLGQRIKLVYQGYIEAGRPLVKEFTVPSVQRGMLVYVFRVGNEKVTGKLISTK